jgi:hypothetical protein
MPARRLTGPAGLNPRREPTSAQLNGVRPHRGIPTCCVGDPLSREPSRLPDTANVDNDVERRDRCRRRFDPLHESSFAAGRRHPMWAAPPARPVRGGSTRYRAASLRCVVRCLSRARGDLVEIARAGLTHASRTSRDRVCGDDVSPTRNHRRGTTDAEPPTRRGAGAMGVGSRDRPGAVAHRVTGDGVPRNASLCCTWTPLVIWSVIEQAASLCGTPVAAHRRCCAPRVAG